MNDKIFRYILQSNLSEKGKIGSLFMVLFFLALPSIRNHPKLAY